MNKLPLIDRDLTYGTVTDQISAPVLTRKAPMSWYITFAASLPLVFMLHYAIGYLFVKGIGIWGVNIPIGWGFAIINFVWWIGIGHAGTLISAILFLLHQHWRTAINRFAEAMTLFAVACAGIFPLIHVGRPWRAYFLFPYPNVMGLWPQFRSPLVWDVFAVSTYATVSLIFWYVGLLPDVASLRDRAKSRLGQVVYGMMSFGWRGSTRHWNRYQTLYKLLAGLATPLVLSVHTVVSFDFAVGIVPGWHTTIFPPYFVAGAVYGGFAMVLTLMIPVRKAYHMENLVNARHIDYMAQVMLATGLIVAYGYLMEACTVWYSDNPFEIYMLVNRLKGPYHYVYASLLLCNIVIPQLLWFKRIRYQTWTVWAIALVVNVGMWLERFMIVATSLHRDFLPSSWGMYVPTRWDLWTFFGTIGLFVMLMWIFIRFIPMISIFESREMIDHEKEKAHA